MKKYLAEFFGTFWLVFGGCGSAVLAAKFLSTDPTPVNLGIGFVGVALAFGLTVMTMALFWVAPIIGAAIAGVVYPLMAGKESGKA